MKMRQQDGYIAYHVNSKSQAYHVYKLRVVKYSYGQRYTFVDAATFETHIHTSTNFSSRRVVR